MQSSHLSLQIKQGQKEREWDRERESWLKNYYAEEEEKKAQTLIN